MPAKIKEVDRSLKSSALWITTAYFTYPGPKRGCKISTWKNFSVSNTRIVSIKKNVCKSKQLTIVKSDLNTTNRKPLPLLLQDVAVSAFTWRRYMSSLQASSTLSICHLSAVPIHRFLCDVLPLFRVSGYFLNSQNLSSREYTLNWFCSPRQVLIS